MATFPEAQGLRILCIDGGGIKGYTALLITFTLGTTLRFRMACFCSLWVLTHLSERGSFACVEKMRAREKSFGSLSMPGA